MGRAASRLLAFAFIVVSIGIAPLPASAQSMRDVKVCENSASPAAEIIRTCGIFIRAKRLNGQRIPNNIMASTYIRRAAAYARIYEFDRAIDDYTAALEISPTPADVLSSRGFTNATAGNDELALADFEASLRINPKQAFSLQGRGSIYLRRFDYDRALADLNQSIAYNPNLAWSYYSRSTVHYVKGDAARGDADVQKAIQLEPGSRGSFEENASFTKNWIQYLREIQNDRDYANWSRPPLDAYTSPH